MKRGGCPIDLILPPSSGGSAVSSAPRAEAVSRTASNDPSASARATGRRVDGGAASRSSMKSRSPFDGMESHFPQNRTHTKRRAGARPSSERGERAVDRHDAVSDSTASASGSSSDGRRHERGTGTDGIRARRHARHGAGDGDSICSPSLQTPRRPASGASGGSSARALAAARRTATRGARSMARRGRSRRDMGSTRRSNGRCCDRRVPRGRVEYARRLGLDRAARRGSAARRA